MEPHIFGGDGFILTRKKLFNLVIFIIIVLATIAGTIYVMKRYGYVSKISKVKELKGKNLYNLDFEQDTEYYDPYSFDLEKSKKFLDTIYGSKIDILGQFAFTNHLINGIPIPDEIYLNFNQYKFANIKVDGGKALEENDFAYIENRPIPFLVGKYYLHKYNLGEVYDLNIMGQVHSAKVVGVIEANQYYVNTLDLNIDLDKAIIIPMDKNFIDKFLTDPDMIEMYLRNSTYNGDEETMRKLSWSKEENGIYDAKFVKLDDSISNWEKGYFNRTRNFLILEIFILLALLLATVFFGVKVFKK